MTMTKTNESTETYLKTIYLVKQKRGNVRAVDIANELGVSKPSVSIAVKKLCNEGFLSVDSNHNLILTDDGLKYADSIFERHVVIEAFLTDILDIEKETAHIDACRLEHSLSTETFNKIKEFLKESIYSAHRAQIQAFFQ